MVYASRACIQMWMVIACATAVLLTFRTRSNALTLTNITQPIPVWLSALPHSYTQSLFALHTAVDSSQSNDFFQCQSLPIKWAKNNFTTVEIMNVSWRTICFVILASLALTIFLIQYTLRNSLDRKSYDSDKSKSFDWIFWFVLFWIDHF